MLLGSKLTIFFTLAVQLQPALGLTKVSAGSNHTCAINRIGALYCWGSNQYGQAGASAGTSLDNVLAPRAVPFMRETVQDVDAGSGRTCATKQQPDGALKASCWGTDYMDGLGASGTGQSSSPRSVTGLESGTPRVFTSDHVCALRETGRVFCWGNNDHGQVGSGSPSIFNGVPDATEIDTRDLVEVHGAPNTFRELAVGNSHTCGITTASSVHCWGRNNAGQLGLTTSTGALSRPGRASIFAGQNASSVSAGSQHTCVLRETGIVTCFGFNGNGELGGGRDEFGLIADRGLVTGLPSAIKVTSGANHNCALSVSREAYCWGRNHLGQLGDGSDTTRPSAVKVRGIPEPLDQISAGSAHTCALGLSGQLYCWGSNANGQLGNGSRLDSLLPVPVDVPGNIIAPQDEPALSNFVLPPPNPSSTSCPSGFFIASVSDGPGAMVNAGAFGMEVLLDEPGARTLAGGLNFGGLIDAGQVGFAGFTIANPGNEGQRLNLNLTGSPASSSGASLPVRVRISRRTATSSETVFEAAPTISLAAPYITSIDLPPAFYEATVAPLSGTAGGSPEGQFFFSLTTTFINRPGGGFQGGAVVGGYHATHPFGGVSGFAAFCLATPHSTSIRVLSQPSYGPTGAKDLRLRLQDAQQREIVTVPSG